MATNHSFWETQQFFKGYDVLVVGAGIVGLSAALTLKAQQPNLKVAVLEAGHLPSGASTKNAGFACFGSISELLEFEKRSSAARVLELVKLRWEGLGLLRKNIGDANLEFQQCGGFEIFRSTEIRMSKLCRDKISYFNDLLASVLGADNVYCDATAKVDEFGLSDVCCMIENRLEGQIDSGKMMAALMTRVSGLGVHVFTNTTVQCIESVNSSQRVVTQHGCYETKAVIVATNAFATQLLPHLDVVPGRGQVLVTKPLPNLKLRGTFHYQDGFYYFRNVGQRVLLGGGRNLDFKAEETLQPGLSLKIQESLEALLRDVILPGTKFEIEQRWSGVMAFGEDVEPIISMIRPGLFCAVRCNGMGVAMGSGSGSQVARLALQSV
ncbi:MAG: FAD-binding oxidoreductase [Oligoflexia bacterium]|nr:FAD-binding oxidoreductase [Oligoflexia bacterium]